MHSQNWRRVFLSPTAHGMLAYSYHQMGDEKAAQRERSLARLARNTRLWQNELSGWLERGPMRRVVVSASSVVEDVDPPLGPASVDPFPIEPCHPAAIGEDAWETLGDGVSL